MPLALAYPEAVKALVRTWPGASIVGVGDDPRSYWRLFVRLWNDRQPFVLVEHDVVVDRDTIPSLATCPRPWCAFPYHELPGDPVTGLGCTKITPDGSGIDVLDPKYGNPVWQNVDSVVGGILTDRYHKVHVHEPWLRHLNPKVAAMQKDREPA